MGYKSRPEGWMTPYCLQGWCKNQGQDICVKCFNKSKFEDCRSTCMNNPNACDICEEASEYEANGTDNV